jgi:hypothetical protein
MRKLITLIVLLTAIGVPAAIAQTSGNSRTPSSSGVKAGGPLPAPVGHRQPRPDEVPSEKNLSDPSDPVNREDALLDKKIKSICRGC